ncbi:ATP-binding cassette domain-containing protein [Paracoccus liaowanqingii]|uniref:ATP-binding cassette domain-containing protein n=1 Tax=Paracoccus liaowanqingii TaxID=2560053 RepID=A0A4Z1CDG4_9RHOB|nr:ATP-binding cassette domain-containing protein [Paracoccus liaowanqingii]TGN62398.1 ATP-binding cassette domain-containing protein [Paracoccus liaowanqingii]
MQRQPSLSGHPVVGLDDLMTGYGSHAAIHHVTGEFAQGSLTEIVGPNGSGKSTLLKTTAGLLAPRSGTCTAGRWTMRQSC